MACQPLSRFLRDDVPMLLRRLPQPVLDEHYQSDDEFILGLIRLTGVRLKVEEAVAVAMIRLLFMSVLNAPSIGKHFEEALQTMIDCACTQIIQQA